MELSIHSSCSVDNGPEPAKPLSRQHDFAGSGGVYVSCSPIRQRCSLARADGLDIPQAQTPAEERTAKVRDPLTICHSLEQNLDEGVSEFSKV